MLGFVFTTMNPMLVLLSSDQQNAPFYFPIKMQTPAAMASTGSKMAA
jgi:hypothetical protein